MIAEKRGQRGAVPDVVRAKSFQVVDDTGRVVVQLSAMDGGGAVAVCDKNGNVVLALSVVKGEGLFSTCDSNGKMLVMVSRDEGGNGAITTFSPSSQKKLVEICGTTGGGGVVVFNKGERAVAGFGADANGDGEVTVQNRRGRQNTLRPHEPSDAKTSQENLDS